MSTTTKIEWTDTTWNPVTGCDRVSEGCDHCYAEGIAHRFAGTPAFPRGFAVTLHPGRLDLPLRWRRPRRVFVNSMSDLFHDQVPDAFIVEVFARMWWAQTHTFQVLTKRPGRAHSLLPRIGEQLRARATDLKLVDRPTPLTWPLPNVWFGVSVETQRWADIRIPLLLDTPAAVRWVSCEPLLGPLNLSRWLTGPAPLGWVVAGGESGPGHRPADPAWVHALATQTTAADVPFFFKQWGGRTPKAGGRQLDGRTWDQMPAVTR